MQIWTQLATPPPEPAMRVAIYVKNGEGTDTVPNAPNIFTSTGASGSTFTFSDATDESDSLTNTASDWVNMARTDWTYVQTLGDSSHALVVGLLGEAP